jgi:hypothetical protein
MTDPVIDTALAQGVKVHLCVTLFSGHSAFFSNSVAQQRLIDNLISIINQRGIHGINIDFEAVPSSQGQNLTTFIQQLSSQLHTILPGSELSIATPAVNWSNTFDLPALVPWIDLFMIMTYDYYWGSSSLAGPVAGLWPLTSSFNYSTSRSITYYQSQGVSADKILMGVPYYGRDWPVASNTLPAQTTGSGTALTYRQIVGSGNNNYSYNNYYWDYRSYNPYYSYQSGTWRQCFFDNTRSLGHKYNIVNRRALAGIGIWALGYDNGHEELWDLIEDKFTGMPAEACSDTLYDTGGPIWNYNNNEAYIETIETNHTGPLILEFNALSLETGYDSLWIYDGASVAAELLLSLSGNDLPTYGNKNTLVISTTSNIFTLRFKSEEQTTNAGYQLTWSCPTASLEESTEESSVVYVYPNPATDYLSIYNIENTPIEITVTDMKGIRKERLILSPGVTTISTKNYKPGLYSYSYIRNNQVVAGKFIIQ